LGPEGSVDGDFFEETAGGEVGYNVVREGFEGGDGADEAVGGGGGEDS